MATTTNAQYDRLGIGWRVIPDSSFQISWIGEMDFRKRAPRLEAAPLGDDLRAAKAHDFLQSHARIDGSPTRRRSHRRAERT
jgi:hypothetical protein